MALVGLADALEIAQRVSSRFSLSPTLLGLPIRQASPFHQLAHSAILLLAAAKGGHLN
jgi:hypothetical protein